MRLPFLLLTPACLAVGVAVAWWEGASLPVWSLTLIVLGGLAAHVAVNALNEYHDYCSGLDDITQPTPFSGGSQALPRHPGLERVALATGVVAMVIAACVGLVFTVTVGVGLLPLGLLGLVSLVAYTPWFTRNPWICLVAPGTGFGLLMVMGSGYVLAGHYSVTLFTASLIPFFLVNNLLLLNQLPDVAADRTVGRRTLPILIGRRQSVLVYAAQFGLAYLVVLIGWLGELLPTGCLIALAPAMLAVVSVRLAWLHARSVPDLIPALGLNVVINLSTPLLLAIGFFISGQLAG